MSAFRDAVQAEWDAAWPAAGRERLVVTDAMPGTWPHCAKAAPVLWVYLTGHLRSFSQRIANLRNFLIGSSPCWFVVLHTLSDIEVKTHAPWRSEHPALSVMTNISVPFTIKDASRKLSPCSQGIVPPTNPSANCGGFAWAVAQRAVDLKVHSAIPQNMAAVASLARVVARHHEVPLQASDVVLLSRPDVVFAAPLHLAQLERLTHATARTGGLLLLLRHGLQRGPEAKLGTVQDPSSLASIGWHDPVESTLLCSRAALERLCPARRSCAGVVSMRNDKEEIIAEQLAVMKEPNATICGHEYFRLLIHEANARGVRVFFAPPTWRVQLLRPQSSKEAAIITAGVNGGTRLLAVADTMGARVELTNALRCAVSRDEHRVHACTHVVGRCAKYSRMQSHTSSRTPASSGRPCGEPSVAKTPWGKAVFKTSFTSGGRLFLCRDTLTVDEALRVVARGGDFMT